MYSVQMVLEQARARVRDAEEERQGVSLFLSAYSQLREAQPAIELLQRRMQEVLRQTRESTAA